MAEVTIRLEALDGTWETCGVDRLRGIVPEGVQLTANEWGSDTCSFTLKRKPGYVYPDLSAFTPCEVEVDGVTVWSGRVWETPTREGADAGISVQGRGWQYHLDDDTYERVYVHTRLSDWKDARSWATADLSKWRTEAQVESGAGVVSIARPQGSNLKGTLSPRDPAGVFLDLGHDSTATWVHVEWESVLGATDVDCNIAGHDTDPSIGTGTRITNLQSGGGWAASGTYSAAISGRYITLFTTSGTSADSVIPAEVTWKIKAVRVFTNTAYQAANASILKASDIIKDARDKATLLLDKSNDKIVTPSFSIPDFVIDSPVSAREAIEAANAYHNWRTKVTVDRKINFQPRPTVPLFEVGEWSGAEFEDASANSGEEIYSAVDVTGTGPDGESITATSHAVGGDKRLSTSPTLVNPSFDTDLAGWTEAGSGSIVRTVAAGEPHTTPGGLRWDSPALNDYVEGSFTGDVFKSGVTYYLQFAIKLVTYPINTDVNFLFGNIASGDYSTYTRNYPTSAYSVRTVVWTPAVDTAAASVKIRFVMSAVPQQIFLDTFTLLVGRSTLIERRGFVRRKVLPVDAALTQSVGAQIGAAWLSTRTTTPLKGTIKATKGGVRYWRGGAKVSPSILLLNTGELINLSHRPTPTGDWGRDGTIANVSWEAESDVATVAIDNERRNFEALISRLSAVVGR